jgi:hypothetical protein
MNKRIKIATELKRSISKIVAVSQRSNCHLYNFHFFRHRYTSWISLLLLYIRYNFNYFLLFTLHIKLTVSVFYRNHEDKFLSPTKISYLSTRKSGGMGSMLLIAYVYLTWISLNNPPPIHCNRSNSVTNVLKSYMQ